jgi:hypothetical protein
MAPISHHSSPIIFVRQDYTITQLNSYTKYNQPNGTHNPSPIIFVRQDYTITQLNSYTKYNQPNGTHLPSLISHYIRPSGLHNYTVEQLHKIQSAEWHPSPITHHSSPIIFVRMALIHLVTHPLIHLYKLYKLIHPEIFLNQSLCDLLINFSSQSVANNSTIIIPCKEKDGFVWKND